MPKLTCKPQSRLKSSPESRRLCRAALRRFGTERKAAYALRLSSQGAFHKILKGKMKDTFEMKAALRRAYERGQHAWGMIPESPECAIDSSVMKTVISELKLMLVHLEELIPKQD